jgi:hypothetical protein
MPARAFGTIRSLAGTLAAGTAFEVLVEQSFGAGSCAADRRTGSRIVRIRMVTLKSMVRRARFASCVALLSGCVADDAEPPVSDTAVGIHYQHVRTCARFLGRPGQFFAYRIKSIQNQGPTAFRFEPSQLGFTGSNSPDAEPALLVPEFSDLEVPAGRSQASEELYLLERSAEGVPPPGAVLLTYNAPDVRMIREPVDLAYDLEAGCDEFNT